MSFSFGDRWLGLWVCDDGRGVRIGRAAHRISLSVTDAHGASLAELVGDCIAPYPDHLRDPSCVPTLRMGQVRADVGEGITARSYTLYFAALDTTPGASFRYRPAGADDAIADVLLHPDCGASMLEIVTDDPWSNPGYGTIDWALPYLPFTHADALRVLHPLVRRPSEYWSVTVGDDPPAHPPGRAVVEAKARGWCELRCGRCGCTAVDVTDAVDDSGTAWRQLHAVVRCGRCGRSTRWHLDD